MCLWNPQDAFFKLCSTAFAEKGPAKGKALDEYKKIAKPIASKYLKSHAAES